MEQIVALLSSCPGIIISIHFNDTWLPEDCFGIDVWYVMDITSFNTFVNVIRVLRFSGWSSNTQMQAIQRHRKSSSMVRWKSSTLIVSAIYHIKWGVYCPRNSANVYSGWLLKLTRHPYMYYSFNSKSRIEKREVTHPPLLLLIDVVDGYQDTDAGRRTLTLVLTPLSHNGRHVNSFAHAQIPSSTNITGSRICTQS